MARPKRSSSKRCPIVSSIGARPEELIVPASGWDGGVGKSMGGIIVRPDPGTDRRLHTVTVVTRAP